MMDDVTLFDDLIHQRPPCLPRDPVQVMYSTRNSDCVCMYVNDKVRLAPMRVFLPIPNLPNTMPFLRLPNAYQIPSLLLLLLFQNPENGSSPLSRKLGAPLLPSPSSTPQ